MDVRLRRTDNSSFTFFFLITLLIKFTASIQQYANEKILCAPRRFDVKAARNIDKATPQTQDVN